MRLKLILEVKVSYGRIMRKVLFSEKRGVGESERQRLRRDQRE